MTIGHTPGPWIVGKQSKKLTYRLIDAKNWGSLAKVVVRMEGASENNKQGEANAHLIAAAPDMFRVLELILNSDMAQREEDEGEISTELAHARAAVAKAEGK